MPWLTQDLTFKALLQAHPHQTYTDYVMAGVDDEMAQTYSKPRLPRSIGDNHFKRWVREQLLLVSSNKPSVQSTLTMTQLIDVVADFYDVDHDKIIKVVSFIQCQLCEQHHSPSPHSRQRR